jgi:N-acetylmuramoyl-L-alanine amidase
MPGFVADFNGVTVVNVIDDLPRKGEVRNFEEGDDLLGVFVHHAAAEANVFGIANYHVNSAGWEHIGYHFVVERNGTIEQSLPLTAKGYHISFSPKYGNDPSKAPNGDWDYWNAHGVAICLAGNCDLKAPSPEQWASAVKLAVAFKRGNPNLIVQGHREVDGQNTKCPGKYVDMDRFRADVDRALSGGAVPVAANPDGPSAGDDPFFRQFPSWREAAINAKGIADDALERMRKAARLLEVAIPREQEALRILREVAKDG